MTESTYLIFLVVCLFLGYTVWLLIETLQRRSRERQISADLMEFREDSIKLLQRQVRALKIEVDALKAGILLAGEEPTHSGASLDLTVEPGIVLPTVASWSRVLVPVPPANPEA